MLKLHIKRRFYFRILKKTDKTASRQLKQKQNKKPDRSEKTLLRSGHFISKFIRCFLFAAFFTFPKVHNRDEHRFHPSNRENSGCRRSSKRGKDVYPHRIFRTSIRHKAHLRDFFRFVCQPVKLCPHCNVTAFYITERTYSFSAFGRQRCGFSVIYDIFES